MKVKLSKVVAEQNLNKDSLVIDCGGYLGDYTQEIVDKFDCSVVIFEPVPSSASACEERFADNDRVRVFPFAVGDVAGKRELYLNGESSSFFKSSEKTKKVQVIRLAGFLLGKKVDCLKLNCEGSEYEVLQDLYNEDMLKDIKEILVQFHRIGKIKIWSFRRLLDKTHHHIPCTKWDLWRLR